MFGERKDWRNGEPIWNYCPPNNLQLTSVVTVRRTGNGYSVAWWGTGTIYGLAEQIHWMKVEDMQAYVEAQWRLK